MVRALRAAALSLAVALAAPVAALAQQVPDAARLRGVRDVGISTVAFLGGRLAAWDEPTPRPPCWLASRLLEGRGAETLRRHVAGLAVRTTADVGAEARALIADMATSERLVRESRGGPVPPEVREADARASRRGEAIEERPYVLVRVASDQDQAAGVCVGSVAAEVRFIPRAEQRPSFRADRFIAPVVLYEDAPCLVAAPAGEAFQAAIMTCVSRAMERLSPVLVAGRNLPAPPPAAR